MGTWEHKKGDLAVQAWISVEFESILGPHFESVLLTLGQHMSFVFMLVARSRFLLMSGFESERLRL